MIPVTTFAGKKVAVFGLGGSGLASASALAGRRRRRDRLRRRCAERRQGHCAPAFRPPICGRPTGRRSPRWCWRPACRSPIRRRIGRRARARAGVEVIGDIELFCRERATHRAGRAVRRHHRHQRQIDHHGADRAPRPHRPACDAQLGGNIGTAILSLAAAASRPRPRDRMLVLSDRSRAHARSVGRHPDQSQRGPSRPPRHAWRTTPR